MTLDDDIKQTAEQLSVALTDFGYFADDEPLMEYFETVTTPILRAFAERVREPQFDTWFCVAHKPDRPHPTGTCFVCNGLRPLRDSPCGVEGHRVVDWVIGVQNSDGFDMTCLACQREQRVREQVAEELAAPYPEDVFPPVSESEMKEVHYILLSNARIHISSDRLHAQWARHWAAAIRGGGKP